MAIGRKLLHACWLAVLLGIGLEAVLLAVRTLTGGETGSAVYAADMAQKVSWSVIVCVGVAAGTSVTRALRLLAAGLAGFIASPLAFAAAKGVHKAIAASVELDLAGPEQSLPSPWVIALIKGSEFAILGVLLGWLGSQADAALRQYVLCGVLVGGVFGTLLVGYSYWVTIPHPAATAVVPQAINELIYPLGCATVIYCSGRLGKRLAPSSR